MCCIKYKLVNMCKNINMELCHVKHKDVTVCHIKNKHVIMCQIYSIYM